MKTETKDEGAKMKKQDAIAKYGPAMKATAANIREIFPTRQSILDFYRDVRGLAWPESFGASPWDTASMIAYIVAGGEVTNPAVLASDEYAAAKSY